MTKRIHVRQTSDGRWRAAADLGDRVFISDSFDRREDAERIAGHAITIHERRHAKTPQERHAGIAGIAHAFMDQEDAGRE